MEISDIRSRIVTVPYVDELVEDERFYEKETDDDQRWVQRNVLVEAETDTGLIGVGEAAHSPGVLGETAEGSKRALDLYAPRLEGIDPFDVVAARRIMDRVTRAGNHAAKGAIDVALHDVMGKATGRPVYDLLGGTAREHVATHICPPTRAPDRTAADVASFVEDGYEYFKVKMSGNVDADLARAESLLDHVGPAITLSLDANQGWSVHETVRIADALERDENYAGNVILEQPIHRADLDGLATISRSTRIPVLADEAATTPEDVLEIVEQGAADLISVKVNRSGGFTPAREQVAIAEAANVPYVIDEINETRVANTAVAHLALAAPDPLYAGCTCHLWLDDDVVSEGGTIVDGGTVTVPDAPGLGIESIRPEYAPGT